MERRFPLQRHWRMALCSLALAASTSTGLAQPTFDDHFASYDIPPQSHSLAQGAVDLTKIAPAADGANASPAQPLGEGMASFYGSELNGRRTASGEKFDMHALTAAHRTLPFGSLVRVTNLANNRSVVVRINDRGPFSNKRLIDVSRAAAEEIGLVRSGHGMVRLEQVE